MRIWIEYEEIFRDVTGETVICEDWKQGIQEAIYLSSKHETIMAILFKAEVKPGKIETFPFFVFDGNIVAVTTLASIYEQLELYIHDHSET